MLSIPLSNQPDGLCGHIKRHKDMIKHFHFYATASGVQVCKFCLSSLSCFIFFLMDMYIRIKRQKTTYFLQVQPTDTILEVKQKLQEYCEQVKGGNTCSVSSGACQE